MQVYPTNYTLKVFDLKSNKLTDHNLNVNRGLHATNGNIIWNVKFYFHSETIEIDNQYFLSDCINKIREVIEPKGFRILVKCSDYDAAHSGMQADMSAGTLIYKLKELDSKGQFASYDVLAESDINSVVSLKEQRKSKENILMTLKRKKKLLIVATCQE